MVLRHFTHVCEVSVLDVLGQPVLDEVSDLLANWDNSSLDCLHNSKMSVSVVSNVMCIVRDMSKMFIVESHQLVPDCFVTSVCFHLSDNIEKSNVLIIHLLDFNSEALIPNIGIRDNIVSSKEELASVCMISVLDVLCKPVLCFRNNFLVQGNLCRLEFGLELKMLDVVAMTIIVGNFAEFRFFIVKVTSQKTLAVVIHFLVVRIISTISDAIKQQLV